MEKRFATGFIQTLLGLVFNMMWNGKVAIKIMIEKQGLLEKS